VDFRLDDDQLALQDAVRSWCAREHPLDDLPSTVDVPTGREAWSRLADLGTFALLAPPDAGGLGTGAVEAAVVFEQLGAFAVPGPLLWSCLAGALAGGPDGAAGDAFEGVADGSRIVTGVEIDPVSTDPVLLEHPDTADTVVVLAPDGISVLDRATLGPVTPLDPLDPLTPVGRVEGARDGQAPTGRVVGGAAEAGRLRDLGTVLASALLVGIADASLDVARRYALERQQFGRPIGSFQALKHLMADMYVRAALARSATYAAAALLDQGDEHEVAGARAARRSAKLLAGDAAIANARSAVQVLGGMGFTWEMPAHFLLKRAWVLETTFGTSRQHALALSDALAADVPSHEPAHETTTGAA
jgi:alkylation response protein AidB-like acyl-CoA dehydrogenase